MRTLVLGGYGHFGQLICRRLAQDGDVEVVVAGRDARKARELAREIGAAHACVDADDPRLAASLGESGAKIVVSTAGPFQGQDHRLARASIAAGMHYIDIADARDFVCGIRALDGEARERAVLVVSGASSVPALSGAVVDRYARDFAALEGIDFGICTSSRLPGQATVRAVLGYAGRPFPRWEESRWVDAYGWQGLRRHRFREPAFSRWIADCDVPDLALLAERHPGVRSVRFGAGVQPAAMQWGLSALAAGVRTGVLPPLSRWADGLARMGRRFERLGTGRSAMFVTLRGHDAQGKAKRVTWELVAEDHDGANIPCMAAVVLAAKMARGELAQRGAMPCIGLITLDEYLGALQPLKVRWALHPG